MRVTMLAVGSRGDVEPYVVLARALHRAGHGVRIATHTEFAATVTGAGIEFATLPGNPREVLSSPEGQAMLATRNPFAMARRMSALVGPELEKSYGAAEDACRDADLVVHATLAMMGLNVADRVGVPGVAAHLQPATPTSAFAAAGVPGTRDLPGPLNRLTWALTDRLMWQAFRPPLAAQRARLGLGPLPAGPVSGWPQGRRPASLYGFSPAVVPVPRDWPSDAHVTGYWAADPDPVWTPPTALADFLAAGPPPVYLGFGSMPDRDPAALAELVLTAARRTGQRVVLLSGWGGLGSLAGGDGRRDDILVVDDVPHGWLFPRMAAVVHHGGAGTTAAGLRAGVPTVVVPFFADQFFWGRRVAALGAGPTPLPREHITADFLTAALRAALQPGPAAAARAVAARLAGEDGPGAAVAVLERLAAR